MGEPDGPYTMPCWSCEGLDRERGLPPGVAFAEGEPQRLHVDLLFDTLEQEIDVRGMNELLQSIVAGAQEEEEDRPPRVQVTRRTLPELEGVIASISVKYTTSLPDGTRVRATCNVRRKEADRPSFRRGRGGDGGGEDDGEEGDSEDAASHRIARAPRPPGP